MSDLRTTVSERLQSAVFTKTPWSNFRNGRHRLTIRLSALVALCLGLSHVAVGQITLFADFPSAALDLANSEVKGRRISLSGLESWTAWEDYYRNFYFGLEGTQGERPTFRIGKSDNRFLGPGPSADAVFYSHDQATWTRFDNVGAGLEGLVFNNDESFTQNEVYVSYGIPYSVSRTIEKVEMWSQSPFVSPTSSADETLQIGSVPNTTPYGPSNLPLHGFSITDGSSGHEKQAVVLLAGNHSGEYSGNWALEGTVDFLLSDDPRAGELRERAQFFIYPQADPLGRIEGYYRGNSQNDFVDHNRAWNPETNPDHFGFTEIATLHAAILKDTSGYEAIDKFFDYHGDPGRDPYYVLADPKAVNSRLVNRMKSLDPEFVATDIEDYFRGLCEDTGDCGLNDISMYGFQGLKDIVEKYTPEFPYHSDVADYLQAGTNYGLALHTSIVQTCDVNGDGNCTVDDIDAMTQRVMDEIESPEQRVQLIEQSMPQGFQTFIGDSNLDGQFDEQDFVSVFASGAYLMGEHAGWAQGDWNGDFLFDEADFVAAFTAGGYLAGQRVSAVPEPTISPLWGLGLLLVRYRRRI